MTDQPRCAHCGSSDIAVDVSASVAEIENKRGRHMGWAIYEAVSKSFFSLQPKEPILIDICRDCGTVRHYVRNARQPWQTRPES